ncbi:FISUMP domain-containing protein [Thermodesulfobacteriota bacterium]
MCKTIIKVLLFLVLSSYSAFAQDSGTFTDVRDGNSYKWIKIGHQHWMAENLKYKTSRGSGYYDLNLYGRFYTWDAAKRACPNGWHLPSDTEWKGLESTLGMNLSDINRNDYYSNSNNLGIKLKSKSGWRFYLQNGNGRDLYGFKALPGGYFHYYTKRFMLYGTSISFWSSSSFDREKAIARSLDSANDRIERDEYFNKLHGCYVRCVKD